MPPPPASREGQIIIRNMTIIPDLTTPVPVINLSSTSLNHTPANQLNLESDREADMELDEDSDSEPCEDNSEDFF